MWGLRFFFFSKIAKISPCPLIFSPVILNVSPLPPMVFHSKAAPPWKILFSCWQEACARCGGKGTPWKLRIWREYYLPLCANSYAVLVFSVQCLSFSYAPHLIFCAYNFPMAFFAPSVHFCQSPKMHPKAFMNIYSISVPLWLQFTGDLLFLLLKCNLLWIHWYRPVVMVQWLYKLSSVIQQMWKMWAFKRF